MALLLTLSIMPLVIFTFTVARGRNLQRKLRLQMVTYEVHGQQHHVGEKIGGARGSLESIPSKVLQETRTVCLESLLIVVDAHKVERFNP